MKEDTGNKTVILLLGVKQGINFISSDPVIFKERLNKMKI